MTIAAELQSLAPSAIIELFVLDMSDKPGGLPLYFHAGTNGLQQPVIWQGIEYMPLPIEAEGFEMSTKGAMPRPRIRAANVNGMFSAEVRDNDDLVGCKVYRKRTFVRYLDAVNFPNGNPEANPDQHLTDDLWYVERKMSENRYMVEWELASAFDLQGVMLPTRQVIQNTCGWRYRGAECGWTGGNFDKNDQPCEAANDFCGKRLSSCKVRFGSPDSAFAIVNNILPYGGFPGSVRNESNN